MLDRRGSVPHRRRRNPGRRAPSLWLRPAFCYRRRTPVRQDPADPRQAPPPATEELPDDRARPVRRRPARPARAARPGERPRAAGGAIHAEGRREALRVETKSSPRTWSVRSTRRRSASSSTACAANARTTPSSVRRGRHGTARAGYAGSSTPWTGRPTTCTAIRPTPSPSRSRSEARSGWASSSTPARAAVPGGRRIGYLRDDHRVEVRVPHGLATALVATGFWSAAEQRDHEGAVLAALIGHIRDIRRGGSAALDLCRLAAGEVDTYWELDLSPWDFAAGVLIARGRRGGPAGAGRPRRGPRRRRHAPVAHAGVRGAAARGRRDHVAGRRGLSRAARGARAARR